MKQGIITLIILIFTINNSFGQIDIPQGKKVKETKTLFSKNNKVRPYISLEAQATEILNTPTVLTGFNGGVIINNHFIFGLGGLGRITSTVINNIDQEGKEYESYLEGGYGGLVLGYIIAPKELIHLSFPVLVGAGEITHSNRDYYLREFFGELELTYNTVNHTTTYFVVEPAMEVEVNVNKFLKLGLKGSYRFSKELKTEELTTKDFDNFNIGLSLKIGNF